MSLPMACTFKRHVGARKLLIHKRIVSRVTVFVIGGVIVEVLLGQVYKVKCVVIKHPRDPW